MEILNIFKMYFKHTLTASVTQKNNCDGVLINKVAGCHLTKKELHHSIFWMNFVKLLISAFY